MYWKRKRRKYYDLEEILAILEARLVLKLIRFLSEGCYYLKYAEIDDLEKKLQKKRVVWPTERPLRDFMEVDL